MTSLILASRSAIRQDMLSKVGLQFDVIPASVDEREMETEWPNTTVQERALRLANAKAVAVSHANRDALIIGADQILVHQDRILHKANSIEDAVEKLLALQASEHQLISAASLAKNGEIVWQDYETAKLLMRPLSPQHIRDYIAANREAALTSVGAYRLEEAGAALFQAVHGDSFTVLGLPLFKLLAALRDHGIDPLAPDGRS